ncbi:phosphotransferase, partial [Candidatus Viridilinea mediisalina]
MTINGEHSPITLAGLRVLVVDNDAELRQQTVALLEKWGCQAFAPTDTGQALFDAAITTAAAHCCQLAVVDMRLLDDTSTQDISGLELVPELRPAFTIINSAFGHVRHAADAFHEYGAADFVAKEDGPEVLERALKRVVAKHAIARYTSDARRTDIEWSDGGQSLTSLRQSLMEDKRYVPEDEANDLIGRLFVDAQRVVLVPIVDEQLPSDAPLASTTSPNLRRETRIFLTQVDHQPVRLVLKLGKHQKIEREVENYRRYVEHGLGGLFRPEMRGHKYLWNMGGVIYGLVGNADVSNSDGPHSFSQFYRTEHDPSIILQPLQHFFHRQHWGRWYQTGVQPLDGSIFQAYDAMLHGKLSLSMQKWHALDRDAYFPALRQALTNPLRWLSDHHHTANLVANPRKAITHGDLHGDNLFVTPLHAWPIDFERTGEGPILRDFVELIQDILTRIAQFEL